MQITSGGNRSVGALGISAVYNDGATHATDWFLVPPNMPMNMGIGVTATYAAGGFWTMQFQVEPGGDAFDHPYLVNVTDAAVSGNIAFPINAVRFQIKNCTAFRAVALIPGFQAQSKVYP